jgi:hypothetical protein
MGRSRLPPLQVDMDPAGETTTILGMVALSPQVKNMAQADVTMMIAMAAARLLRIVMGPADVMMMIATAAVAAPVMMIALVLLVPVMTVADKPAETTLRPLARIPMAAANAVTTTTSLLVHE